MAELVEVTDAGHPLLSDFVALNDPAGRREVERRGDYFVVEGTLAIEQLAGTAWQVRALALLPKVAARLGPVLDQLDAPVAIAQQDVLRQVVGFDLHRGALASVQRRPLPAVGALLADPRCPSLLVVTEGVNDHENLGALCRNAAAFGAGVVLDPTTADPFYRRAIRVSLGHVLRVPMATSSELPGGLGPLHAHGVTTLALTPGGDVALDQLPPISGPVAVLVGAEGPGLRAETIAAAHHRVRIDVAEGVDSLNVATATAIALHQLRQ